MAGPAVGVTTTTKGADDLRLLVDSIHDHALFMVDPEGFITTWSAGAARVEGYATNEAVGQHFSMFYSANDIAARKPEADLAAALRDGRFAEHAWRLRKDRTRFWANVSISTVMSSDGKHAGFALAISDETERREADDRLRQSERTMRLLVDGITDYAIFKLDTRGVISTWNAGAERLQGYTAKEAIGRPLSMFYTEADRAHGHPDSILKLALAEGVYREEGWRVRKGGGHFWAYVVITALFDDEGRHVGFGKVTRDMTEKRNAEETLRAVNRALSEQVQLQQAAAAEVEAFSYSVSHDLRAPLRAVDGFSKLLEEKAGDKLDGDERRYLEHVRAAAKHMSELVDALLQLSQVAREPIERVAVDLSAIAATVVEDMRRADPARKVAITVQPGLTAQSDPRLARVVLENLLRNAWKFTRLRADAEIAVGEEGGAVFVRDNGIGLDMAEADRIFTAFQRLHAKEFEGSGVGLATVARIVDRHGGRVWVESEPGRGATFKFTLG